MNPLCRRWSSLRKFGWVAVALAGNAAGVEVDATFPGGNVRILARDGDVFTVAPDLRDTAGWWFHFHFRVRGNAGEKATLVFPEANPIGVRGPAVSMDGGWTWKWLGLAAVRQSEHEGKARWSFEVAIPEGTGEVRCAFAPVYLESHLGRWLETNRRHQALRVSDLAKSRKGRTVELLRAGCLDDAKARGRVLLTARHHACESMANYVLEGVLDAVLADDETGRAWRGNWQLVAVPLMDKDGVEDGDQGKNRIPHDHNRDYNDKPLYPEVAAWMKLANAPGPPTVFSLDLHCPHIRGEWNDRVYLVGSADPAAAERERSFAACLERARQGPIPYRADDGYLPAGVAWNRPSSYNAGRSNGAWSRAKFPASRFAGTMEIAYASASGAEVNPESARAFGRDLAKAILAHLEQVPAPRP